MNILAIETSCDESSIAILSVEGSLPSPTFTVRAHNTASQIEMHKQYGGVFPSVAKREHAKALTPLLEATLGDAGMLDKISSNISDEKYGPITELLHREPEIVADLRKFTDNHTLYNIDYLCVTTGPGLAPSLWVGVNFAKALSILFDIPVMPVNHMKGHIWSVFATDEEFTLPEIQFPMLALLISGGHTELDLVHSYSSYEKIGQTRDDAVGEAFDKVGRMLGLPYPAGPIIDKLASSSLDTGEVPEGRRGIKNNPNTPQSRSSLSRQIPYIEEHRIQLPRPMLHSDDLDFSFSGLKTAVRNLIADLEKTNSKVLTNIRMKSDIASEFQNAVTDVLIHKTRKAIEEHSPSSIIISGGVSANSQIRKSCSELADEYNIDCHIPPLSLTGDNALMIGIAGAISILENKKCTDVDEIVANGNLAP